MSEALRPRRSRPDGRLLCGLEGRANSLIALRGGIAQVDQEIMAFYKAREKLVHDRMARAQ